MNYYLLINGKTFIEGDTIDFLFTNNEINLTTEVGPKDTYVRATIKKIYAKSQYVDLMFDILNTSFSIPLKTWPTALIVKKEKLTDPNLIFKFKNK